MVQVLALRPRRSLAPVAVAPASWCQKGSVCRLGKDALGYASPRAVTLVKDNCEMQLSLAMMDLWASPPEGRAVG